ncbi:MAG TPA: hypothetical protein VHB72_02840 [Candidatus Saccharimonadales bacterium]|nr:hypothetical protein [Candidatus Saccharimonadales bacterium]
MPQKKRRSAEPPAQQPQEKPKAEESSQDAATAPEVSGELLKELGSEAVVAGAPAKPTKPPAAKETTEKPETKPQPDESEPTQGTHSERDKTADLDNSKTDQAVDAIAEEEADTILALQDAAGEEASEEPSGWKAKLKRLLKSKWTWLGVLLILIVLFAVPYTRYKLIGIFIKEKVTVTVIDSKTATPVSNATVKLAGKTGETSGEGKVTLKVSPGKTKLTVTKQYYKPASSSYFVKMKAASTSVRFVATGRQVPVTILNTITGQPVSGAEIKALNTSAKTNGRGVATIVLPASASTDAGTIQESGYNAAKITIQVTDQAVPANTFKLTPSGKVYFLSNTNGTIDVTKASLDGSGQQVVLAGTGDESAATTSLFASRDWHYLVLEAQRDGSQPALYLINTSNDKVTAFDTSNASFTPIGWYAHSFMYDSVSNVAPLSQAGHEAVKSYNADQQQLNQLDQNQTETNATGGYIYQHFYNFNVLNNLLTYNTQWYASAKGGDVSSKTGSIRGIQPDGQNKKDYQTYSNNGLAAVQSVLYQPQAVYYNVNNAASQTYYNFANQTVDTVSLNAATFNQTYPPYLISPGGALTFWVQNQGGQSSVFTGDNNAARPSQIASGSNYAPYGWFTDKYIIVSKDHNELFALPAGKGKDGWQPVKIGDYYRTAPIGSGYSYGNF